MKSCVKPLNLQDKETVICQTENENRTESFTFTVLDF